MFLFRKKGFELTDQKIHIYKSELSVIQQETTKYPSSETGGDLFGTFTHGLAPVIWFATGPGPLSKRTAYEFEQDSAFRTEWQKLLMDEFAIQYIGAWHSHHQLGLQQPSNGDIQAAEKYLERHKRSRTIEIIVTNDKYGMNLNIIPYYYEETTGWQQANFRIINKTSPIREIIILDQQKPDNVANNSFNAFNNQPAYNTQQRQQLKEELESEKPVNSESLDPNESRRITVEVEHLQEEKSVVPILIQIEIQILADNNINVETEIHDDYYILVCEISKGKSVAIALRYNNPFIDIVRIDLINRFSNSNIDITEQIKNIKPLNRLGRKGILLEVIGLINENYLSLLRRGN